MFCCFRFLGIEPYNICHVIECVDSMGDLPEKHDLVIFIIRFKPQCLGNIRFFGIALVIFEKCEKCDRTAYQKAKEKCDNRKRQLEKKYKKMTIGYESILFLLAWYSITTTLFTAILSPVFLNDCNIFFGALGKGMGSLFREFVIGADSFGQLSSGIPNRILSGLMYWLIVAIVMGILFIITGLLIVGIGYQVGKIYRKYCWDIISIVEVITSTVIAIYFGDWIKSVISINLITLLLLVHVVYIGIRCYVKDWMEERGYC